MCGQPEGVIISRAKNFLIYHGQAMQVKSEVTIKFSGSLPTATPAANKVRFVG
jgi:hypothetical protein